MSDEQKIESKKKKYEESGCMAPLLYWSSLGAIFFIGNLLRETDEDFSIKFFGVAIVIWFLTPIWASILGKNLKETADNVVTLGYLIGMVIVGLIVLLIIGAILPSSCMPSGGEFRPPRSL